MMKFKYKANWLLDKMKQKIFIIVILSLFLLGSFQSTISESVKNQRKTTTLNSSQLDEWTVMIYMAADNDLEWNANYDLDKLRAATSMDDTNSVNIIVLLDEYGLSNTKLYSLENGILVDLDDNESIIPSNGEVNSGNPETLTNFGTWTINNYPANHYMLILWGHGLKRHYYWTSPSSSFWFRVCYDRISNRAIRISEGELKNSLKEITNNGQTKIDILGFDACLTGLLEIGYEVRNYADYMIAPQDNQYMFNQMGELDDYGFNYQIPISSLVDNPTYYSGSQQIEELCIKFVENYPIDYYDGSTLSTYKLSSLETLIEDMDNLGQRLYDKIIVEKNPEYIKKSYPHFIEECVYNKVKEFTLNFPNQNPYCAHYADLYDFAEQINTYYSFDEDLCDIADNIKDKVEQIVIAENGQVQRAHGISFCHANPNCNIGDSLSKYRNLLFPQDTQWGEFIIQFNSRWSGNSAPEPKVISGPPEVYPDIEYELVIKADDADGDFVYFEISWDDGEDSQNCGPYESGEEVTLTNTWSKDSCKTGEYTWVRVESYDAWEDGSWTKHNFYKRPKSKSRDIQNQFLLGSPLLLKLLVLLNNLFS